MSELKAISDLVLPQLNTLISENNDRNGKTESFYFEEDTFSEDFPPSLLRYFETSSERAAAICEMLSCDKVEEDDKIEEYLFSLKMSHCETDSFCEEEDQRKQRELDFQEELKKIREANKLYQVELELEKKKAQEKLELDFLLQQELIINFKKQVQQKKRMIEVELKMRKAEEERTQREKEKRRKRQEEDYNKLQEERRREEGERKEKLEAQLDEKRKQGMMEYEEEQNGTEEDMRKEKEGKNEEILFQKHEIRRIVAEEETVKEEWTGMPRVTDKVRIEDGKKNESIKLKNAPTKMAEDGNTKTENSGKEEEEGLVLKTPMKAAISLENVEMDNKDKIGETAEDKKSLANKTGYEKEIKKEEEIRPSVKVEDKKSDSELKLDEEKQKIRPKKQLIEGKRCEGKSVNEMKQEIKRTNAEKRGMKEPQENDRSPVKGDGSTGLEVDFSSNMEEAEADKKENIKVKNTEVMNSEGESEEKKSESKREDMQSSDSNRENTWMRHAEDLSSTEPQPSSTFNEPKGSITIGGPPSEENLHQPSTVEPRSLRGQAEQKRLSWRKESVHWYELFLQNKKKRDGSVQTWRGLRRSAEVDALPSFCAQTLLQVSGWRSLQEITVLTLEDMPACSLSTLARCQLLQSLTLRRCGLKSLEGLTHLKKLCYIDLQENDVSYVDCENMTSLQVLRLAHNKLSSIHGLRGAENLNALDLSYNSITRIAGLESAKRLQRLLVDHNHLISTKGLREMFALLQLDLSYNHLGDITGLESCALLNTLDLRGNSLSEPPSLKSHVLLRELHLDDNNISSLEVLSECWLPLLQNLSLAQNRITELPSMTDFVCLQNLDLSLNCLSELDNVCGNLEGCLFLQEVLLSGNPLQQDHSWRSRLQEAVPRIRSTNSQQTEASLATQEISSAPECFLSLCLAQLQQNRHLEQLRSTQLRNASSPLDVLRIDCQHFMLALQLAEDQWLAQENADRRATDQQLSGCKSPSEESLVTERKHSELSPDSIETISSKSPAQGNARRDAVRSNKSSRDGTPSGSKSTSSNPSAAAAVIQRRWRKHREKRGDGGKASRGDEDERSEEPCTAYDQHRAAAVIQAFWRGFALRRRLASALAGVASSDSEEEDTFEEVDVEQFIFDEPALDKLCFKTPSLSEQTPSQKCSFENASQFPLQLKQAWMAERQTQHCAAESLSEGDTSSSVLHGSTLVLSRLYERSETVMKEWGFSDSGTALLMLKRAQKMKSSKQTQEKRDMHSAMFEGCNQQWNPADVRRRPARHHRCFLKAGEARFGFQQHIKKMEEKRRPPDERGRHCRPAGPGREPDSGLCLPEISPSVQSRGKIQRVVERADRGQPAHGGSNSAPVHQGRKSRLCSGEGVCSPSSRKEPIFVELSGWSGGKNRDRLHK